MRWFFDCSFVLFVWRPGQVRGAGAGPNHGRAGGDRTDAARATGKAWSFRPCSPTAARATSPPPPTFVLDKPIAGITNGFLAPSADGSATLTVAFAGQTAKVPVMVKKAAEVEALRFRTDVMPVLTKVGCNTGKCHGSASGKDGFRLSLFGYDPDGDHFRITREMGGRRVNLATPDDCLIVNKATGKVPHTGGKRLEPGSENHLLLVRWLEAGAPSDPKDTPKPVGIEVFPKQAVFAAKGQAQRVVVRAKYCDGTDRDVTRFTVFVGNNDAARPSPRPASSPAPGRARRSSSRGSTSSPRGRPSSSAPARHSRTRRRRRSTTSTPTSTRSSTSCTSSRRRSAATRSSSAASTST